VSVFRAVGCGEVHIMLSKAQEAERRALAGLREACACAYEHKSTEVVFR
jgi:hypothetical protein